MAVVSLGYGCLWDYEPEAPSEVPAPADDDTTAPSGDLPDQHLAGAGLALSPLDPPPPEGGDGACGIEVAGDRYPIEAVPWEATFRCAPGADPGWTLSVSGLPEGGWCGRPGPSVTCGWTAPLDAAGAGTRWLSVSAQHPSGAAESRLVGLEPADSLDHPDNVPPDPESYRTEFGLPILWLTLDPELNSDFDTPAVLVYRGERYDLEAQYRGGMSTYFPKRSYTLDFPSGHHFDDDDLGFDGANKLLLISTFNDNSQIRHRLSFWNWGRLDPARLTPNAASGVVYLWDEALSRHAYHGLYVMSERVDAAFFGDRGLTEDGQLFKGALTYADFSTDWSDGSPKDPPWLGWEKKGGLPEHGEEGAYDPIVELSEWVTGSDGEEFAAEVEDRLEVDEFVDWWCFIVYHLLWDNSAHNAYVYQAPAGGRWRYVPWDPDGSFGQDGRTTRQGHDAFPDFRGSNHVFDRLLGDPEWSDRVYDRLWELIAPGEPLSGDVLAEEVEELAGEVGPAARRDEQVWGDEYRSFELWADTRDAADDWTTFDQEVEYMREWVELRSAWIPRALEELGHPQDR